MTPVTDPEILRQLDGAKPVTDARVLAELNSGMDTNPTSGNSFLQNFTAGYGKAAPDVALGVRQMTGNASQEDVDASRRTDAPLMNTWGGRLGNVAGNVMLAAPTLMIPGANTVTGAGVFSALQGLLQPVGTGESRTKNTAVTAALGAGGQKVGGMVADEVGARLADATAKAAKTQSLNSVRDATFREASELGFVAPPSAMGAGFTTRRLEGVAGKAALGQAASAKNQEAMNAVARRAVGIADDAPVTAEALDAIRQTAAQPYRDVAALSPRAASALERLKDTRFESKAYWKHYNVTADPKSLKAAMQFDDTAEVLERLIEKEAVRNGSPRLLDQLKEARTLIAKTHDIEKALNDATGNVSLRTFAALFDKGKLSGELSTAGRFAKGFSQYTQEGSKIPTPGVSKVEAGMSALLGTLGATTMGGAGVALAALPLASTPVRNALLSKAVQSRVSPSYDASATNRLLDQILSGDRGANALRLTAPAAYQSN